jgi:hypothetical protein
MLGDPGQWTYLRNLGTRTLLVVIIHNTIYPNFPLKKNEKINKFKHPSILFATYLKN